MEKWLFIAVLIVVTIALFSLADEEPDGTEMDADYDPLAGERD